MAFGAAARKTSLQLIEGRLRRTNEHRALGWRGCIWPKAGDTMSDYLGGGAFGPFFLVFFFSDLSSTIGTNHSVEVRWTCWTNIVTSPLAVPGRSVTESTRQPD